MTSPAVPRPAPAARRSGIAWLVFAVFVLAAVLVWARRMLRSHDEVGLLDAAGDFTVWGMHACVVAIVGGVFASAPALHRLLGRRRLWIAAGVAVAGFLACGLAPRLNRILFDEHIYMQVGQTLALTGRAECASYARADYGGFELVSGWVNKQPNGLPYLHALAYRIFGVSVEVSHTLNRVLIGGAAAWLYLALCLAPWRLPRGAPLAAALLFLATPLVPWWGHTAAVEPAAAASVILAFAAAALHARERSPDNAQGGAASAVWLAGATAFAAYFRPESLLVFPFVTLVLWSEDERFVRDLFAWAALALALALIVPNLLHLYAVRGEDWGATDGRRFDPAFLAENWSANAGYFFSGRWFPAAGTVFAFIGACWLFVRSLGAALAIGAWFALSWGTFLFFYAGSYEYGASSRYGVLSAAPVAVAMGVGAAWLWPRARRFPLVAGGLLAALALHWAVAFRYVPVEGREAASAREDVAFVNKLAAELPADSLVISRAPTVWLLAGRSATELSRIEPFARRDLRELMSQYPGGVYAHYGYWESSEPPLGEALGRFLVDFSAEEVARHACQRHVFALHRVDTPAALARFGGPPLQNPDRVERHDAMLARLRTEKTASEATR